MHLSSRGLNALTFLIQSNRHCGSLCFVENDISLNGGQQTHLAKPMYFTNVFMPFFQMVAAAITFFNGTIFF
jgi:hypothetical protein